MCRSDAFWGGARAEQIARHAWQHATRGARCFAHWSRAVQSLFRLAGGGSEMWRYLSLVFRVLALESGVDIGREKGLKAGSGAYWETVERKRKSWTSSVRSASGRCAEGRT